jgi:hypothetical protein
MYWEFLMGAGDRAARKSRETLRENIARTDAIKLPELEKLFLDQLSSAGELTPELEQAILQQSSAMEGVSTDPRLKSQQMSALEQLAGIAETGMSPADQAAFELARRNSAQEEQARQGQILQEMQARGQGGSGIELISRLKSNQSAADRLQEAQLQQAQAQQQARMQALGQVGNLSSQVREQDFGEQERIARATDMINQFNAQNQQGVQSRNVGSKNQAMQANLQNQQNILNQNVGLRNKQQQFNKGLSQQQFQNELAKQQARSGQVGSLSNSYAQSAANAGALEGQLISGALTIGGAMLGGPAGAAAGSAAASSLSPSQGDFMSAVQNSPATPITSTMNFDPTKFANRT